MNFDRYAICLAYYLFSVNCHGGQFTKEYAYQGRLAKIGFKPSRSEEYLDVLKKDGYENAREIYENLCKNANLDSFLD